MFKSNINHPGLYDAVKEGNWTLCFVSGGGTFKGIIPETHLTFC